jgi:glucuronosyltransferase
MAAATDGVIVVSLGTFANSSSMSSSQAKAFLGAFSKLSSYRIYWRVGPSIQLPGVDPKSIPDHINISAFLPQNDLLGELFPNEHHLSGAKETRLLITNGGMLSVIEAITHAVPMLGIPLYGSNKHNLAKIERRGLGLVLPKEMLTETNLYNSIRSLLDNPKCSLYLDFLRLSSRYTQKARAAHRTIKERPMSAFDSALHWIQEIGNHRARRPSMPSSLTFLNLDVLLLISLPVSISFTILLAIISRLLFRVTTSVLDRIRQNLIRIKDKAE